MENNARVELVEGDSLGMVVFGVINEAPWHPRPFSRRGQARRCAAPTPSRLGGAGYKAPERNMVRREVVVGRDDGGQPRPAPP